MTARPASYRPGMIVDALQGTAREKRVLKRRLGSRDVSATFAVSLSDLASRSQNSHRGEDEEFYGVSVACVKSRCALIFLSRAPLTITRRKRHEDGAEGNVVKLVL